MLERYKRVHHLDDDDESDEDDDEVDVYLDNKDDENQQ